MFTPKNRAEDTLQPEVILPAQFAGTSRRQAPSLTGEVGLMIAILEDAVLCYQKFFFAKGNRGRRLFREAEEWIMDGRRYVRPNQEEIPSISFDFVCDVLDLDPSYVRQTLQRWSEEQLLGGQLACSYTERCGRQRRPSRSQGLPAPRAPVHAPLARTG